MDGIALALAAKRDYPDLTILLMTGFADQRERASGLEAIVADVLDEAVLAGRSARDGGAALAYLDPAGARDPDADAPARPARMRAAAPAGLHASDLSPSLVEAQPHRPGDGRSRPDHEGDRAADPSRHHLSSATRTTPIRRASSMAAPTTPRCARPRASSPCSRSAGRGAALRLRHGGGDRRVPGARPRRPRGRAQGDVLGAAQLARRREAARWGLARRFRRDGRSRRALEAALRPGRTKLVWIETPSNPLWTHHRHRRRGRDRARGRRPPRASIRPPPRRSIRGPLALGADIVMHAATKDPERSFRRRRRRARGRAARRVLGAHRRRSARARARILGPFEAYLLMRGLRTLHLRAAAQAASAARPRRAPRRASATSPACSIRACRSIPATTSPRARWRTASASCCRSRSPAASAPRSRRGARVGLWKRATSLGGVESLIEHRASVEGPGTPCPPDLLRLSTGIEDPDDLYDDLDRALTAAHEAAAEEASVTG